MGKKSHVLISAIFILILSLLIACSDETTKPEVDEEKPVTNEKEPQGKPLEFSDEEVTLKVATPWGEEYFMNRIGNYASEKNPHITLEHIDWDGSAEQLQEFYADGIVPDVFLAFSGQQPLEELDSVYPLDEMLKLYDIDISHIQPVIIDEIRARDKERRLIGIPQEVGLLGLYYNKEIFDLFGVSYPEPDESMTWDEAMDLTRKMTAQRNGVNYCGLDMGLQEWAPLSELSANMTDPETGEVLISEDPKFTKYMELMDQFYQIPGIQDETCTFSGKTAAMLIGWHGFANASIGGETTEEILENKKEMDVVPLPTWSDLPDVGPAPRGIHPWTINKHSENKDVALQFILTGASEEYQLKLAREGTPSVMHTTESIEQFGADTKMMQDINVGAFFHNTPAAPPKIKSVWDQYVDLDMEKYVESGVDFQEFLRIVKEESEIKIEEAKQTN